MPKTVSALEAKNRLGSLLGYVSEQDDEVIVENRGKPKAVISELPAFARIWYQYADERGAADTRHYLATGHPR